MTDDLVVERVAVDLIDASPAQNRVVFDPTALRELADSISELGLLQPVVVRPAGERFELIAGERRLRAVKLLGEVKIDAMIRHESDETAALSTLVENMVRVDPGPLEEARGLAQAADAYGLTPAQLAQKLGKSARWVRDRLALLTLAEDVAHFVQAGTLPIGRAVLMSELDTNRQRLALQAHERGIGPDAFRALVSRLADEQSADSMFDTDAFMKVEEYVMEAQESVAAASPADTGARETPLGQAEIAELLGVRRRTIEVWRTRDLGFPEPDAIISGTPIWYRDRVEAWARSTGRLA